MHQIIKRKILIISFSFVPINSTFDSVDHCNPHIIYQMERWLVGAQIELMKEMMYLIMSHHKSFRTLSLTNWVFLASSFLYVVLWSLSAKSWRSFVVVLNLRNMINADANLVSATVKSFIFMSSLNIASLMDKLMSIDNCNRLYLYMFTISQLIFSTLLCIN